MRFLRNWLGRVQTTRPEGRDSNCVVPAGGACPAIKERASKGKVRLHPLPQSANEELSAYLGAVIGGAVRDAFNMHPMGLTKRQSGLLLGSIRKRAVNQLVCAEGEAKLRAILNEKRLA